MQDSNDRGVAPNSEQALVIGAGTIGSALARRWLDDPRYAAVSMIHRSGREAVKGTVSLITDHSEASIERCLAQIQARPGRVSRVAITLGTLHGDDYRPEKSLRELNMDTLARVHRVNCALPLCWLAALAPLLRKADDCRIAVLSARVGSIEDNHLGGWYSYRSAKAALNMGLRCAAIELARSAPGVTLIAYHPGTVDSPLSAPFQSGVPEGKLFNPAFAAECLSTVMDSREADGELAYLDWAGEVIPW